MLLSISVDTQRPKSNTRSHGEWRPPLKIKISKIGLRHVLSWPKLDIEPQFHDPGTFDGFGKREQTDNIYKYILNFLNLKSVHSLG